MTTTKTGHSDTTGCDCLVLARPNADGCQFLHCEGDGLESIIEFTDGTTMHEVCSRIYDRTWHRLHPQASDEFAASAEDAAWNRFSAFHEGY